MDSFGRIRNRAIERSPTSSQPKRRHHQPRIAEYRLRLIQSLAFHTADEPLCIHIHIVERQRCRVAQADAVLIFWFVVGKPRNAFFDDDPARSGRCVRLNGVRIGNPAIADPFFAPVDFVAYDSAILHDAVCRGAKCRQIAAGFRFRRSIGELQSFFCNAREPLLFLFRRSANGDRIAP